MKKLFLAIFLMLLISTSAFASVNVLSGNLSHRQTLFAAQGGPMAARMQLSYNSFDKINGSLGAGWSHSYDIYLHTNSDGTQVLTGGVSKRFYFPSASGGYISRIGDSSTITDNGNGTFKIDFADGRVYNFGSNMKITSIVDRHNNTLNFDYSVADQLTVTDPLGRTVLIHYNTDSQIDYLQDPSGKQYDFTYVGNAISQAAGTILPGETLLGSISYPAPDAAHPVWNYLYTTEDLLEYITDPEQQITRYGYTNGKCTSVIDPNGVFDTSGSEDPTDHQKLFAFDTPAAGQTTLTEKDGGQWVYTYDVAMGVLTSKQGPDGNTVSYTQYATGDWIGLRESISSPIDVDSSYITEYLAYDTNNNATEIKGFVRHGGATPGDDPTDMHRVLVYDNLDRLTSVTDQITGAVTTLSYTGTGAETVTITAPKINSADSTGPQTVLLFRTDGQLDLVTDPLSRQIDYAYDVNGLLQSATDLSTGQSSTFSNFDTMGRPQTVTSASSAGSRATTLVYDDLGRVKSVSRDGIDPQTQQAITYLTSFGYDLIGNRTSVTDSELNTTDFEHNYRGQVTKITDALTQTTELLYSGAGCASCGGGVDKLTDLINAKNYNPANTDGPKSSFRYDQTGQLKSESDELGNARLYAYDTAGRLTDVYQDEVGAQGGVDGQIDLGIDTHLLTYVWSDDSKLSSKTDQVSGETTSFSYYPLPTAPATDSHAGRLQTASNLASSYTFDYFDNGWLKSVDDGTTQITYLYDAAGRRELVTIKQGATTLQTLDYVYHATTKRLQDIVAGSNTFSFGYDGWGRRSSLAYPNGVNASYSYRDDMDWLTGIDYPEIGLSLGYDQHDKVGNRKTRTEDGVATDYTYDDTYQLTQAKTGAAEENYVYDAVGNRESGPTVKDTAAVSYTHDDANRMLQGRKFGYEYDNRGNRTRTYLSADQTKRWEFSWDGENKLTEAKLVANASTLRTVSFKYDPFGRRVEKQVVDSATLTTSYTYDGEDIILQTVNNGTITTSTQFIHGPGIDEPLAMSNAAGTFNYHADGLGSIVAITDSNKNIVQRYSYEAFGQLTASDPIFDNFYTYTGREYDKETGLYYYRARYYDAMEGRFISKDPIGFAGGDVNLYGYVLNNPGNWIDPYGLDSYVSITRDTYSNDTVISTIVVTNDAGDTFTGYALEDARAGTNRNLDPVQPGAYPAFVRTDRHNRIELSGTINQGLANIQLHSGNSTRDVEGCWAVGNTQGDDFVGDSRNAMQSLMDVINNDGTGNITVHVIGGSTNANQ